MSFDFYLIPVYKETDGGKWIHADESDEVFISNSKEYYTRVYYYTFHYNGQFSGAKPFVFDFFFVLSKPAVSHCENYRRTSLFLNFLDRNFWFPFTSKE